MKIRSGFRSTASRLTFRTSDETVPEATTSAPSPGVQVIELVVWNVDVLELQQIAELKQP